MKNEDRDFIPRLGSGELPDLSDYTVIGPDDFQRGCELWNARMPSEYENLLYARVVGERDHQFTVEQRGDWRFLANVQRYRNSKSGLVVNAPRFVQLRDDFTDALHADAESLCVSMVDRDITLHVWVERMARLIQEAHLTLFMLGSGGYNTIDSEGIVVLERTLDHQFALLRDYAQRILHRNVPPEQQRVFELGRRILRRGVINRGIMFIEAATQSGERGRTVSYGFHPDILPHYPGDGSTECLWRCRCHWRLRFPRGQNSFYYAFWRLKRRDAGNCGTCLVYAEQYNPYIVVRF